MKISVLTLFPQMFNGPFDYSIIKKARGKKIVEIKYVNIRDFGIGKHKIVDDKPYGGGKGMILRVDVLEKAITKTKDKSLTTKDQKVILLDPHGKIFNQKVAKQLSLLEHLILICGHYEGVDNRILNSIDESISVGDFVATGGEIPAMLVIDTVVRLIKGTLKKEVTENESFSPFLEYPQYTKPRVYKDLSVPEILLSGNHKKITEWRKQLSLTNTLKLRPDLASFKRVS